MKRFTRFVIVSWFIVMVLAIVAIVTLAVVKPSDAQLGVILKIAIIIIAIIFGVGLGIFFFRKGNWQNYSWLHGFGRYSWVKKDQNDSPNQDE